MARPQQVPKHKPILVQAPVEPLDPDGVIVFVSGTVLFGIATLACLLGQGWLAANGQSWWLWVSVAGSGLGLAGTAYCLTRQRRRLRGLPTR